MTPFVPKDVRVGRENDAVAKGVFLRGWYSSGYLYTSIKVTPQGFFPYLNPSTLLEEGR